MKRSYLLIIASVFVVATAFVVHRVVWPNSIRLRNSSHARISNVTLRLESIDGRWSSVRALSTMEPGETIVVRHGQDDLRARVTFVLDGGHHTYSEPYIDLWRGERWSFDIQSDGRVNSAYEHD